MEMKKNRIALIVDNPLRDLDGMTLLACALVEKGAEVYLVPMYEQLLETAALRPDLILLNYLRSTNCDLAKAYSSGGILVGVLDTEGGVINDVDRNFAGLVQRSGAAACADMYCLWGKNQYDALVRNKVLPESRLYLTGCPRYDYCAAPWRDALPSSGGGRPVILVNTRFPLIFPKYRKNVEQEIQTMKSVGFSEAYAREYARQCYLVWAEMVRSTAELAKAHAEADFVLRPHPFEDKAIYESLFGDIPNIKVIQENSSLYWIKSSRLLLHRDCSTAIEAAFLGVEPVSMEWIDAPILHTPVPAAVSCPAASREQLAALVAGALQGRPPLPPAATLEARKTLVRDWFYAMDGNSSERVAAAIFETIAKSARVKKLSGGKMVFRTGGAAKTGKELLKFLFKSAFGLKNYDRLKSGLFKKPASGSKYFSPGEVSAIVRRLAAVKPAYSGFKIERSPAVIPGLARSSFSIKISS